MDDSEFIREYDIREHKIWTMEEEKRGRVIQAALQEFSKGFAAANTDAIVNEAGISKGLLFHYFGSKRGLFLFLLKYGLNVGFAEYAKVISENCDCIENIRIVSEHAWRLFVKYPLVFGFLAKAQSSINAVFPEGLPRDMPSSPHMLARYICQRSNNDPSRFKEGVDAERAQNIIVWTLNGLSESCLMKYGDDVASYKKRFEEIAREQEEYLGMLRKMLYR